MAKTITLFICFVFIVSCNSQKTDQKEKRPLVSDKVMQFLGEKNFKLVENTQTVIQFNIKKKLIEGTKDEYSNKLILKDTLKPEVRDTFLLKLQDDLLYNWEESTKNDSFEPNKQFLLKGETERLSLVLDEKRNTLGFISLDGQKLVTISKDLTNFLSNL